MVTEETTVWKCEAVAIDDDGHREILPIDADDGFPTERDAIDAAVLAMKRRDTFATASR